MSRIKKCDVFSSRDPARHALTATLPAIGTLVEYERLFDEARDKKAQDLIQRDLSAWLA